MQREGLIEFPATPAGAGALCSMTSKKVSYNGRACLILGGKQNQVGQVFLPAQT